MSSVKEEFTLLKEDLDHIQTNVNEGSILRFYAYGVYAIVSSLILEKPNVDLSETFIPESTAFSDYVRGKYPSLDDDITELDEEIGMAAYDLKDKLQQTPDVGALQALFAYTNNKYRADWMYAEATKDDSHLEKGKFDFGMNACITIIRTIMQTGNDYAKEQAKIILNKILSGYSYPGM